MKRWPVPLWHSVLWMLAIGGCPLAHGSALYVGRSAGSSCVLERITLPDKATNTVFSGSGFISGASYDPVEDHLYYWRRYNSSSYLYRDTEPGVYHGDGSDRDTLADINGSFNARQRYTTIAIDFDPLTRHYYSCFSNPSSGVRDPLAWIQKRHADTGAYTDIYLASRSGHEIMDVAVDPIGNYIYWTDEDAQRIYRRDLDGAFPVETLYTGLNTLRGIAVDRGRGLIFWAQYGYSGAPSSINSASMEGGGTPVTLLSYPAGDRQLSQLSIDPVGGIIYFTEYNPSTGQTLVRQMSSSGADVQDVTYASGTPIQGSSVHFSGENVVVPPDPTPRITSVVRLDATTLQVAFEGLPDTTYALFSDPDLQSGFDDPVTISSGSLTTDANGHATVTCPMPPGTLFLRCAVP